MNRLKARITEIKSHAGISLVKMSARDNILLTSVIIQSSEMLGYFQIGKDVNVLFKETEVIIADIDNYGISIQNKIPCEVQSIINGEILSEVVLTSGKEKIISVITRNGCEQLKLQIGSKVLALIKSNEISLSPND